MMLNSINLSETAKAIIAGVENIPTAGSHFKDALRNVPAPEAWDQSLQIPQGIVMCYGDDEGIAAIVRAYRELKVKVSPAFFAHAVATELNNFAQQFVVERQNLCYAHFLLHGLQQDSVEEVAAKIADNARIIRATEEACQAFLSLELPVSEVTGYRFVLEKGYTDDYQGISLVLANHSSSFAYLAKTGFFLDTENSSAVIINVQGRKSYYRKRTPLETNDPRLKAQYQESLENYRKAAEEGREFARIGARLGMDPRSYVITKLFGLLRQVGISEVKAIRPTEHVMHIGGHRGFRAAYESVLKEVGLSETDPLYFAGKC